MKFLIVANKHRLADYGEFIEALNPLGVEAKCVHILEYCYLSQLRPLNYVPFPRLLKVIKQFDPDFVMTDSPRYVPRFAKLVGQRVFFHMRGDPWTESYWDRAMYPSLLLRMYKQYLDSITDLGTADLILPNSKWLQARVKQHLPSNPTQVLYVGIDSRKWVPGRSASFNVEHPAAVGIFPFNIYAKVAGLLRFIRVVRKMPDVNFYFGGDGAYFNLVKQECPSNMFLVRGIPKSRVRELLDSADVFVHPAGDDALPRCVKEASLMEKAIVASDVGGIPEIVKNNETGYLCRIGDADRWIEKIRFFLDNPDIARRFGKNAREFVGNSFEWGKIARDFVQGLELSR